MDHLVSALRHAFDAMKRQLDRPRADRRPVTFVSEANRLDREELAAGYDAGLKGLACPDGSSRAWWHGWRTGCVDAGREKVSSDQLELVRRVSVANGLALWLQAQPVPDNRAQMH